MTIRPLPFPAALLLLTAASLGVSACDSESISSGLAAIGLNAGVELSHRTQPLTFRGDNVRGRIVGVETEETRRIFHGQSGEELVLKYAVTLERGRLWIIVEEALGSRTIWERRLEGNGQESVTVRLPRTGNYNLVVFRWDFGGAYDVKWRK